MSELYPIGILAQRTGVSIKTIRFYSDRGLLPPSEIAASGYRLYSDTDRVRLDLIRTLRDLDLPLAQIALVLAGTLSPSDALRRQLAAIELQQRNLRRRRAVLRAVLRQDEDGALARLGDLDKLVRLTRLEREAFVAGQLEKRLDGIDADPEWLGKLIESAVGNVPEPANDEQLAAWLEIASLVADDRFLASLREPARSFWQKAGARFDAQTWQEDQDRLMSRALTAIEANESPSGARAQDLVRRWISLHAAVIDEPADATFARDLLGQIEASHDPQVDRFWQLVGVLQSSDEPARRTRAFQWLMQALRTVVG